MSRIEDTLYQLAPSWMRDTLMTAHGARIHVHRYGAPYRSLLQRFGAWERRPSEQNEAEQFDMLRGVLKHAVMHSTHYRRVLRAYGASPEDFNSIEALRSLPVLPRSIVRDHLDDLLTARPPRRGWLHGHTSGTTGSPLSLWYDRPTCLATNAADRLQKRWAGIGDNEWIGVLLGRQVVPVRRAAPPFWHVNHVQRQVWFSSLHLAPKNLPSYVAEIRRRGLQALEGYPSTLFILARSLLDRGETIPMRAVFSSSETLLESQREAIQAAFSAPLFDYYGHAERVVFALECEEHQGKHVLEPFGITEILSSDGKPVPDGEFGYIVGTSLFNRAMPMLRYQTGDISAIDRTPCACGRTFPRIVGVATKAEDIVVLPNGRWLSPSALTHPFKPFPEIVESQVIQESPTRMIVRLAASPDFDSNKETRLLGALRERLGPEVKVEIERVGRIPREPSGKFRWVISKVPHDLRVTWQ